MRILAVNDDGIGSPGLEALAGAALGFGEVWVVAPSRQCSGMSQRLTILEEMELKAVDFPLPVAGAWSVDGTPADCVKLAMELLMPGKPDYVFSGVNNGWNCGFDIAYSGTIGACCEAVLNGVPAIAFSAPFEEKLDLAAAHMPAIIAELLRLGQGTGEIWNVNFPGGDPGKLRGVLWERKPARTQAYQGRYSVRTDEAGRQLCSQRGVMIGKELADGGSDIAAVLDGYISVGKLKNFLL